MIQIHKYIISKFMLNHFSKGEKTTIYGKVVLTKLFSANKQLQALSATLYKKSWFAKIID